MIALIVAHDKNRVIGNKGCIPWNIRGEKQRFKELTTGNVVIMGRKTFEEIGKPLAKRLTIVVSSTKEFEAENCHTVKSLKAALELSKGRDVYISGGARLYEEALEIVDVMYITEIDATFEGDTYFPIFDETKFDKIVEKECEAEYNYRYLTYIRKKA